MEEVFYDDGDKTPPSSPADSCAWTSSLGSAPRNSTVGSDDSVECADKINYALSLRTVEHQLRKFRCVRALEVFFSQKTN
jgi:hypothetical protein